MNVVNSPVIQLKISSEDQLLSLNEVLGQITDAKEHYFWCSGGLPIGQTIPEFPVKEKPIFCWSATDHQGDTVGHMELHNNQFGWVIARVWVHTGWRRRGIARAMYLNTLEFASRFTSRVGAFCYVLNEPSKNLLLDLGFKFHQSYPEQKLGFFIVNPASIKKV